LALFLEYPEVKINLNTHFFRYDLIEADGMSADQLKEIPFVKIE
jgi:hypothetical protein